MTPSPEKPHTDEKEVVCWHFDHTAVRTNQMLFAYVVADTWFGSRESK